ncbi:DUF2946 family protein [Azohydromonas sediminis]|uniref:DUF2946 family protein n=1 Tax=Azohydromonas sediminis TaxID=2259674 RepID=UPI000E64EBD1|nr:DUF2946 family protein [Azohydromonas sediminis]
MSSAGRTRTRRRAIVALVAAWALAVLPALSLALAAIAGERAWAEVCTAQGARWVPLGDAAPDDAGRTAPACEWCVASAHGPALPPPAVVWTTAARSDEPPPAVDGPSASLPAWMHPHPRGPPSTIA